jgi:hypothetical protein
MAAYFRRQGLVPAQQGRVIAGVCARLGPLQTVTVDSPETEADSSGRLG